MNSKLELQKVELSTAEIRTLLDDFKARSFKTMSVAAYAHFAMLRYTGCRIGEVRSAMESFSYNTKLVQFQTQKFGGVRIVNLENAPQVDLDVFKIIQDNNLYLFEYQIRYLADDDKTLSNFHLYKKKVTTHIFRHLLIRELKEQGNTNQQIKEYLALKQIEAVEHYLRSEITTLAYRQITN